MDKIFRKKLYIMLFASIFIFPHNLVNAKAIKIEKTNVENYEDIKILKNVECKVSQIEIFSRKQLKYEFSDVQRTITDNTKIYLALYGPKEMLNLYQVDKNYDVAIDEEEKNIKFKTLTGSELKIAKDDTEKDLFGDNQEIRWSYHFFRKPIFKGKDDNSENVKLGSVTISNLKPLSGNAKAIARLSGDILVSLPGDEKIIKVDGLVAHLNEKFPLGEIGKIYFISILDDVVNYSIEISDKFKKDIMDLMDMVSIEYFSVEGKVIKTKGWSSAGTIMSARLSEKFPENGYVLIKYPIKTEIMKIPFSFTDIPIHIAVQIRKS